MINGSAQNLGRGGGEWMESLIRNQDRWGFERLRKLGGGGHKKINNCGVEKGMKRLT